jgi:hypothetical protein
MRIYKDGIWKWITGNSEQQSNQNEETSETRWENSKKMLTAVPNKVVRFEERSREVIGMMKNLRKMYKSLRITKGRKGNLRTCIEREKKRPMILRCSDEWRKQMRKMKREN